MNSDNSKIPTIRAVTFDMDGLMFNTEDLFDQVGSRLLSRRGHVFSLEVKLKTMGLPGPKAFEVLQREFDLSETYEAFQSEIDEIFSEILPGQLQTMPGLFQLLELLEVREIPKSVATSSHRGFAESVLGRFQLEPRFKFLLTRDDVVHGKPNPDIYLAAAEMLNVAPGEMLVLEDSLIGSSAAVAAGAFTIAVPTSHSQHQDFSHVDRVANSLVDDSILNLFLER